MFNVGYGVGFTVREVLLAMQEVRGVTLQIEEAARRSGDPMSLVADAVGIESALDWKPLHNELRVICKTAYRWERNRVQRGLATRTFSGMA